MFRTLVALAFGLGTLTAAFPQAVQVSTCGQTVPPRGSGVVTTDLTCPSTDPFVVKVEEKGRLDLAGHTLSGAVRGVQCAGRCIVDSSAGAGTIRDAEVGLVVTGRLGKPSNLVFENDGIAILSDFGLTTLRGDQVTITGGFGIQAKSTRISGLTITGAFPAIQGDRVVLDTCSITGCGGSAIRGNFVRLVNCTVTGNDPVDLDTLHRPRLTNSTCDRSSNRSNPTQNWSVCTND